MAQAAKQYLSGLGRGQSYERDERWSAVDDYSFNHLHPISRTTPTHDVLKAAPENSQKEGLPDIAVSPSLGKFLQLQARVLKAKNVLEVGTLGGYSTIWLANASPEIKVTSIEVNEHHAKVAKANIANAGVSDRVEVRLGTGLEEIPKIAEEIKQGKRGKLQLTFIDADKENNWNYVDLAIDISESGAAIIVDNIARQGLLADSKTDNPRVLGARTVVERVGKDDRLDGVVIQTVGEKNYDGFLFAVVK